MGVYALVFNFILEFSIEHYAGFMFVGLLPWIWFSSSFLEGTYSITSGGSLVTKVLFPSQVLPAVKILANLCKLFIEFTGPFRVLVGHGGLSGMASALATGDYLSPFVVS